MADWRTYTKVITISAGIAVTGVLWHGRDNGLIRGEDIAALKAGVVERMYALQFETGTDINNVYTQSVFYKVSDLEFVNNGLRLLLGKSDAWQNTGVFWIDKDYTINAGNITLYNAEMQYSNKTSTATWPGDVRNSYFHTRKISAVYNTDYLHLMQTLDTRTDGSGTQDYYINDTSGTIPTSDYDSLSQLYIPVITRSVVDGDISIDTNLTFSAWGGDDNIWTHFFASTNTPYVMPFSEYETTGVVSTTRFIRTNNLNVVYQVLTNMTRTIAFITSAELSDWDGFNQDGTLYEASYTKTETKTDDESGYNSDTVFTATKAALIAILATNITTVAFSNMRYAEFGSAGFANVYLFYEGSVVDEQGVGETGYSTYEITADISLYEVDGLTLPYPSDYAITNGLCSKIRYYAIMDTTIEEPIHDFSLFNFAGSTDSFNVDTPDEVRASRGNANHFIDMGLAYSPQIWYTNSSANVTLTVSADGYYDDFGTADPWEPITRLALTKLAEGDGSSRPTFSIGEDIELSNLRKRQSQDYSFGVSTGVSPYDTAVEQHQNVYTSFVRSWVVIVDWDFSVGDGTYNPSNSAAPWATP